MSIDVDIPDLRSTLYSLNDKITKFTKSTVAKALAYRLSATFVAQVVSFLIFQSIEVNAGVLLADGIQFCWYYIFEKAWNSEL